MILQATRSRSSSRFLRGQRKAFAILALILFCSLHHEAFAQAIAPKPVAESLVHLTTAGSASAFNLLRLTTLLQVPGIQPMPDSTQVPTDIVVPSPVPAPTTPYPAQVPVSLPPGFVAPQPGPGIPLSNPPIVVDASLQQILDRLERLEQVIAGRQGLGGFNSSFVLPPAAASTYADDQEGIAAINLVPGLSILQASWLTQTPPTPAEASTEAGLTNKIADWTSEIRRKTANFNSNAARLKSNETAISDASRKLDENTVALSKAKFNVAWATTNRNLNALELWKRNQDQLKSTRDGLIATVKQNQAEAIEQIRLNAALNRDIAILKHDVDLANDIILVIKASAPIPGPPLR